MANKNKGKMVQMLSPENYIRKKARSLPIYECRINEAWEDTQLVQLSVARSHVNGNITACFYLVDLMCLGVKDTDFMFNVPVHTYREHMEKINNGLPSVDIVYELAHNIVFAGLEFADDYGFKPHKDFTSVTQFMLEEETDDIELIEIECGVNGEPTYMRGPFDDDLKVKKIIAQLEKTAGQGNYSFIDEDEDYDGDYEDASVEIDDMSFDEKKELFFDLSKRIDKLNEDELHHFGPLVNSLVDEVIDIDQHNIYYDELFEKLCIETDEDYIPNQLLGLSPNDQTVSDEHKLQFIGIYKLILENPKLGKKELKVFEKETKLLPAVSFLELQILRMEDSRKYPKRLKEYVQKYPDYSIIRLFWATEQVTSSKISLSDIPDYPFNPESFFQDRIIIHPIEYLNLLLLYAFVISSENDLCKLEAFDSVLNDLDISEDDEAGIRAIVLIHKVNQLLTLLKR